MFNELFEKFKNKHSKVENDQEDLTLKPFDLAERAEVATPTVKETETAEPPKAEPRQNAGVELKVVRPESYDEVGSIADNLVAGCTVVLNVEALDQRSISRMLDFLNGVAYCLDGGIKKVAPSTFIITHRPDVDITDM